MRMVVKQDCLFSFDGNKSSTLRHGEVIELNDPRSIRKLTQAGKISLETNPMELETKPFYDVEEKENLLPGDEKTVIMRDERERTEITPRRKVKGSPK